MKKYFIFKLHNWWKDTGCGRQFSFTPSLSLWCGDKLEEERAWRYKTYCISFAFLIWCFEIWINPSKENIYHK